MLIYLLDVQILSFTEIGMQSLLARGIYCQAIIYKK